MIVLDASAAVEWLLQTPAGRRIESRIYSRTDTLHAPDLLDLEVTQVFRRLARQGSLPATRLDEALQDFLDLRLNRYPHNLLLSQIWQLRHNFSAYDAAYLVLAESLAAPLITCDSNLASAGAQIASIELY